MWFRLLSRSSKDVQNTNDKTADKNTNYDKNFVPKPLNLRGFGYTLHFSYDARHKPQKDNIKWIYNSTNNAQKPNSH